MRQMNMTLWVIAALFAFLAVGQESANIPATPELPVSLNQIRKALDKPKPNLLALSTVEPTFQVIIREDNVFQELLDRPDFGSGPRMPGGLYAFEQRQLLGKPWAGQPLIQIDVLPLLNAAGRAIGNARRTRLEEAAHEEVQRALMEFCAMHDCGP